MKAAARPRRRAHAALVIAQRLLFETMIGPGIYVAACCALLAAHALVTEFALSIEPGGFNPERTALYRLVYELIVSAFGQTFFDGLFAEGPFVLAYTVSFGLLAVYFASGSVTRLAMERRVGAMELVCYGPADGTSCLLGALGRDMALSLCSALLLLAFLGVLSLRHNLAMGPHLASAAAALFLLAFAVSSMGLLCASLATRAASAAALFTGLLLLFAVLLAARYAGVTGYARTLASALSGALQWFSPLFWWDLAVRMAERGALPACVGLLPLAALSASYLTAAHLLTRSAGSGPW